MEMKPYWEVEESNFQRLLQRLSPDPERASTEYDRLRFRLIKFFQWRRCAHPEDSAARTLDRLARRLEADAQIESPYSYCCGIARMILLEDRRAVEREAEALD